MVTVVVMVVVTVVVVTVVTVIVIVVTGMAMVMVMVVGPRTRTSLNLIFAPKSDLVWGFLDHPQAVRDLIATYPFKFDPTDGAEIMGGLSEVRATDELVFSRISRAFLSFYHSYIRRVIRSRILMGG